MISISYLFLIDEIVLPDQIQRGIETTKRTAYDIKQNFRKERERAKEQAQNIKQSLSQFRPQVSIPAMGAI